jgi:drug/metabolite transporter (DMT)-like permease
MAGAKESWLLIPNVHQGRSFILLAGLLWSLAGIFIKSMALPAVVIVFYRSLFASLFFLLFIRKKKWKVSFHIVISVASYTAAISLFVLSNKLTTAANAIVLQYTAPIFVFLFIRFFFREPISKGNLVTLLLSMVGVAIIFSGSHGGQDQWGVWVAVLSGFLFAIYMMNLRYLAGFDPLVLTFINNLVCSIALLPLMVSHSTPSGGHLLALAVMGVVQLGVPYFLFSKGLESLPVQEASLIVLIEPVLNPIWVAWGVGEVPSIPTLIGGSVILFSLVLRYTWLPSRGISGAAKR